MKNLEQLKRENQRLREALTKIAEHTGESEHDYSRDEWTEAAAFRVCQEIARRELERAE